MHIQQNIAHRDLKLENILFDRLRNIRIIDFGLSYLFDPKSEMMKSNCGTVSYQAPELIMGTYYTTKVDIWALGVILATLTSGFLPFEDQNYRRLAQKILYNEPKFLTNISPSLKDLLKKLLTKDPETRISLSEIKMHPWIAQQHFNSLDSRIGQYNHSTIDQSIVATLKKKGFEVRTLAEDLNNNLITDSTAYYNIVLYNSGKPLITKYPSMGTSILRPMAILPRLRPTIRRPGVCNNQVYYHKRSLRPSNSTNLTFGAQAISKLSPLNPGPLEREE